MRYWQAQTRTSVDAILTLANPRANSSGWWVLEHLDGVGASTVVGHIPPGGGPTTTGVIPILSASLQAWGWGIQHFQWVIIAVTPDNSDITALETMSQGGAPLQATDGFGTAFPGPPVPITPDLKNSQKTACPFAIQFP